MITDRQITQQTCENLRKETDRELLLAIGRKILGDLEIEWYEKEYKTIDQWEQRKLEE